MMEQNKSRAPIRVLFLEDEDVLATLYCKKLEEAGYLVKLCRDAEGLIDSHEAFEPDVAFLDHALHGKNQSGMEMIPILKKAKPDVKIVMLSNYSAFQMEQDARKAGAIDYLLKINISPNELVNYTNKLFNC